MFPAVTLIRGVAYPASSSMEAAAVIGVAGCITDRILEATEEDVPAMP
jgi:hypothetical protein